MGISAIVQIADRLLSRSAAENQTQTANTKPADKNQSNRTDFGDQFTQSGGTNGTDANGEEFLTAEFFRLTAFAAQTGTAANATTAASAGQTAAAQAPAATGNPPVAGPAANTVVSTTPAVTVNTVAPAIAATAAPATPAAVSPVATPTAPPVAAAPVAAVPAASATTSGATAASSANQTSQELQTLNSSLTALGLNASEIAAFDQFATLLLQIDPNGMQELQNELNLLATQFQAQGGTATNASQPSSAAAVAQATPANGAAQTAAPAGATTQAAAPVNAPAPPPTPGFQLSELSVTFNAVSLANNPASGNGQGGATQLSAINLQIQEINVTLGTPAGQTAQIQVSPASSAGGTSAATSAAPSAVPAASPAALAATA